MRQVTPALLLVGALFGLPGVLCGGKLKKPPVQEVQQPSPPDIPKDGPGLLEFFRKRTPSTADAEKIRAAVRFLGDEDFKKRQRASAELTATGLLAVPFVRKALDDPDPEIARRAATILADIEKQNDPAVVAAAAEAVARLKPAGAAGPLLDYLPFARDDIAAEAVQAALEAVAKSDGKADPVLLKALADDNVAKRAAAGVALVRGGPAELRKDLHKLLKDSEPQVRLRVAQAFVTVKDKAGVPVLIALLAELPQEQRWQAEDSLTRLAGDKGPAALEKETSPAKIRAAWAAWWRDNEDKIDLAKLDMASGLLGYTLIVRRDLQTAKGIIEEIGKDGKARWQINLPSYAMDAQMVGKDRVLIAEYAQSKVTERNLKGEVLWQKAISLPIACQRLPNGNTFIATRQQLLEYDRAGRLAFNYTARGNLIYSAKRLRNGETVVINSAGSLTRLDAKGGVIKTFAVGRLMTIGTHFDALANGHFVIPDYRTNKVVEYDGNGNVVWQAEAARPSSAQRLPNGNTLVTTRTNQEIVELDKAGKVVWRHRVAGYLMTASRR
jgi:hypothetical protein